MGRSLGTLGPALSPGRISKWHMSKDRIQRWNLGLKSRELVTDTLLLVHSSCGLCTNRLVLLVFIQVDDMSSNP